MFSEEFRTAVAAWQGLHGFEAGAVFTRHPIQPLDDDEVRARADEVFESILSAITAEAGGRDA